MSLNYWGFTRTPFTKELPIEDFYPSTQFRELAARLHLMVEGWSRGKWDRANRARSVIWRRNSTRRRIPSSTSPNPN